MIRTAALLLGTSFLLDIASLRGESAAGALNGPPTAVTIHTSQGVVDGFVDSRSSDSSLWIRIEHEGVHLASAIEWDDIESAEIAGKAIQVDALRAAYEQFASEGVDPLVTERGPSPALLPGSGRQKYVRPIRVRTLEILDVALVNLDRDVELDGFRLTIAVIGNDDQPRPVRGQLAVELVGERMPRDRGLHSVETLDQWRIPVKPADFVHGVATYNLPMRTSAPDWEFDILPDAIFTASIGVHGEGNYSASAPIVLREFSPMRDNLQLFRGNRFAPAELTSGKPFSRFGPQQGRWPYWPR